MTKYKVCSITSGQLKSISVVNNTKETKSETSQVIKTH